MKASEYKNLVKDKQQTESVELPSGAVFLVRPAPLKQWTMTGILPASLAAKMQLVAQAGKDTQKAAAVVLNSFTEKDFLQQQELGRKLVEFCAVEPKISVDGSNPDAIAPEDMPPDDFEALMKWIWSGGKASAELANFRREGQ
jgi:hypothetical protein